MKYKEAIEQGYIPADTTYTRGYISRKMTHEQLMDSPVFDGGGTRRGQKFVLLPCFHSTNYCLRLYLVKP